MLVRSDMRVGGAVVLALILAGNASFAGAERDRNRRIGDGGDGEETPDRSGGR